jgi:hypothetical protein
VMTMTIALRLYPLQARFCLALQRQLHCHPFQTGSVPTPRRSLVKNKNVTRLRLLFLIPHPVLGVGLALSTRRKHRFDYQSTLACHFFGAIIAIAPLPSCRDSFIWLGFFLPL